MCLVIAVLAAIYAFSAFNAGDSVLGSAAVVVALVFTLMMVKNIISVRKTRNNKRKEAP